MADEMLRIAGRGEDGTAKALKTSNEGEVVTTKNVAFKNKNHTTVPAGGTTEIVVNLKHHDAFRLYIRTTAETAGNVYLVTSYNGGVNGDPNGFQDKATKQNILFSSAEEKYFSNVFKRISPYETVVIRNISAASITFFEIYAFTEEG